MVNNENILFLVCKELSDFLFLANPTAHYMRYKPRVVCEVYLVA